jgi:glycosyltransferase involved in cell wall biosynthesis
MTDLAVIMSVYQNDKLAFLKESVQSILNQTFRDFDFFLVFDGPVSEDISAYISSLNDDRIMFYRLEKNGGLARAMNFLLGKVMENPDYKFIARMDADDISMPLRFEKQRSFLLDYPDISIVGCWFQEIDKSGKILSDCRLPVGHEALRKQYYTKTPFPHASVMFRRNLIENAGMYPTDTILMEDNVLWGKALKAGLKFANIPEFILRFRKDDSFYQRRSGTVYGWNYILTRFRMNKSLKLPLYFYIVTILMGILKMMPADLLKYIYNLKKN